MLKWLRKSQAGQAMVEMALALPVLLMLVGGIVDFGWLYYNKIALNNAAREGARYAVIHYNTSSDWATRSVDIMDSTYVGVDTAIAAVTEDPMNSQIQATMTADIPILTGITSTLIGKSSIEMTGTCTMRIES